MSVIASLNAGIELSLLNVVGKNKALKCRPVAIFEMNWLNKSRWRGSAARILVSFFPRLRRASFRLVRRTLGTSGSHADFFDDAGF